MNLSNLFHFDVHPLLLVVRAATVYLAVVLLLRISGKRQLGQMGATEFVAVLLISNAVQNAMNGGDNSLVGGMVSAATLVALNFVLGLVTARSKKIEAFVEGRPQVLIHNGQLFEDVLASTQMTHHEVQAALRHAGCATVNEVRMAVLEINGSISVIKRDKDA